MSVSAYCREMSWDLSAALQQQKEFLTRDLSVVLQTQRISYQWFIKSFTDTEKKSYWLFSLKTESCHDTNFVSTSHYDNPLCHLWWQSWHWDATSDDKVGIKITLRFQRLQSPGPVFIKPDQPEPWIKDQPAKTLMSVIMSLQFWSFVNAARCHMPQNSKTEAIRLYTGNWFYLILNSWMKVIGFKESRTVTNTNID